MVWSPDYIEVLKGRQERYLSMCSDPCFQIGALEYYKDKPKEFINDWCITYDPRNATKKDIPVIMPFVLFDRQFELIDFLMDCLNEQESGLVRKSRDMGATWVCCCFSVWLWLFVPGSSIGWGSRKETLVDKIGDPDSIFEKMRMVLDFLPRFFWPNEFTIKDNATYMKIVNPINGSTITGEAGNNIGRGGRKSIYFKDESAHYEQPERIESALGDNTNVQIDISSVKGTATIFDRRCRSGEIWVPGKKIKRGIIKVFILDWRDHPLKDEVWYNTRKERAKREGLLAIFAQEVDQDSSAAVEGVVIPATWVRAAIDAHIKLGIKEEGVKIAALDVADEGRDKHALAIRQGVILCDVMDWPQGDPGKATRKTLSICAARKMSMLCYDCVGVGSSVKSEINRLIEDKTESLKRLNIVKWNGGTKALNPNEHILKNSDGSPDTETPKNKDFYANLKTQGWWQLRMRFEKTYKMINGEAIYPHSELIAIPSNLKQLRELENELSQPTVGYDGKGRMLINKKPTGTSSPNLGDAVMMDYWPIPVPILSFSILSLKGNSVWDV